MKDPTRERNDILEILTDAVGLLTRSLDVRVIPLHGAMLGYAIQGARDKNGVAAVKGGIVPGNEKPHPAGPCDFGVDEEIARIILTAMRFDPGIRSAATLRCSRNMLKVMESLLLECTSFETTGEHLGISTMDWGVASCCKAGVPDVCYPYRGRGNESTVLLFGEDPIDVTNNIIMISNRIISIEL
ncbi:MAG: thiamine-phosphate synthase family protein [Methanoregula sp.]|jgi:hydroxymethylpyrimidine/phosphomethylpyrimidine kinase